MVVDDASTDDEEQELPRRVGDYAEDAFVMLRVVAAKSKLRRIARKEDKSQQKETFAAAAKILGSALGRNK